MRKGLVAVAILVAAPLTPSTADWAFASLALHDEPAPPGVAASIQPARESLASELGRGLLHLRFVEPRCAADGAQILVFEQRKALPVPREGGYRLLGPLEGMRWAWVARGAPDAGFGSGGYGITDVGADEEIAYILATGGGEVSCS